MSGLRDFLKQGGGGRWGLVLTLLLVVVALAAPWIAPANPTAQNLPARLSPPSTAHWLGTDELGRDILSRIIFGARVSMLVSISVVLGAGLVGLAIGSLAGYFGGWFDRLVNVVLINAFLSFPGILLAIAFAAFLGPGLGNAMIAIGIAALPTFVRLVRGTVLAIKTEEYVEAAQALGCSRPRVAVRHILPNTLPPLFVQVSITVAAAIIAEASLSFLGLGQQPPAPSWGSMLNAAQRYLSPAPWMALYPGVMIFGIVMALNVLGDGLRDVLDPRHQ